MTGLSLASSLGDPSPANRAARLTNSIRDALNGGDLPITFSLDDDHVGTTPLVLAPADPAPNALSEKVLRFDNSEGRYDVVFQVKAFQGARWDKLDDNPASIALATSSGTLYQLHNSGLILRFIGGTWERLDNNPATVQIAASEDICTSGTTRGSSSGLPARPGNSWTTTRREKP